MNAPLERLILDPSEQIKFRYDSRKLNQSPYQSWVDERVAKLSIEHSIYGNALDSILILLRDVAQAAQEKRISVKDISKCGSDLEGKSNTTVRLL